MTHIEQMIQDMCPHGVEWKTLGEICEIVTKQTGFDYSNTIKPSLLTKQCDGAIPYMQTRNFSGRHFDYNTEYYVPEHIVNQFPKIVLDKKCLLISIVGSIGNVGLFPGDKKCFLGGAICMLKFKQGINISFVYEYMSSIYGQKLLKSKIKGSGQATITIEDIRNFRIPFPPQEIQEKIVAVLEAFSALAAELQARRKQYEYYRTHLLTPTSECNSANKSDDCKWIFTTLGEIGTFTRGRRFVRTDIVEEGQPCIHYGDMYTYYGLTTDHARTYLPKDFPVKLRYAEKGDVIIVGAGENDMDIGVGCVWEGDEPVAVHDACYIFKHKQNPRYISHFLRTLDYHLQIKKNVSTAKICAISPEGIAKAKIALPPLEEQARIVEILDKFEALTTGLTEGIPAEQAAQQKRYEYFRDLLLTFDRKAE